MSKRVVDTKVAQDALDAAARTAVYGNHHDRSGSFLPLKRLSAQKERTHKTPLAGRGEDGSGAKKDKR
jgi:hypothetical protein